MLRLLCVVRRKNVGVCLPMKHGWDWESVCVWVGGGGKGVGDGEVLNMETVR